LVQWPYQWEDDLLRELRVEAELVDGVITQGPAPDEVQHFPYPTRVERPDALRRRRGLVNGAETVLPGPVPAPLSARRQRFAPSDGVTNAGRRAGPEDAFDGNHLSHRAHVLPTLAGPPCLRRRKS